MTLEKAYQPLALEKKWYQHWEQAGYFQPQIKDKTYCIMLPPPNVTGTLHMGHAFQDTLIDVLIRTHRMKGYQTLWQGGTDHAGIATQIVVEKQLPPNQSAASLGREAFVEKIWEWKAQSGNTIVQQMRRLGASVDWSRERFTMDEGLSQTVKEVFIRLYDEGLIYRGQRLVNWDPKLHTAISDLEVISQEEDGFLWYIRYPVANEYVVVATTRPETLLGDVALAVHPEDERYQHLIGKMATLPLCNRTIPIIADQFVDPSFGTGCVKITPAHDFNDYQVGKRHGLTPINIFTFDAMINESAPLAYQGLSRFAAREKIVADLTQQNLLEKVEPHRLNVPRGEKTGEIIEPYLTDQWFVRAKILAQDAIEAVKTGKIEFVPAHWTKIYFEWMNHIEDWCISRQIWWGHRIPAWYDENQNIYVGENEQAVRNKYQLSRTVVLTQEQDVLDTWFSSALWPFSTLNWPAPGWDRYYPTDVLVTGFDIIFFWVARMIMMGLKFTNQVPFKKVFVHGLIQDMHGQKMSKSKGNVIDPIDLIDGISLEALINKRTSGLMQPSMKKQIEKDTRQQFPQGIPSFGTDALRFTFCALSGGRHLRFDLARVEGYRHFCNKLWNASRFVLMHVTDKNLTPPSSFELSERWIWSVWQKIKQQIQQHLETYRFDLLAQVIYDFTWETYCDWYVELSKPHLWHTKPQGVCFTLVAILEELVRALHPIIPFITEEIWQKLTPLLDKSYFVSHESIMLQPYPQENTNLYDVKAELDMEWLQAFIVGVRTIRAEMNVNPQQSVAVLCRTTPELQALITSHTDTLKAVAKLDSLTYLTSDQSPPPAASSIFKALEIFVPLSGLIDKQQEIQRLNKEITKTTKEIQGCENKLADTQYLNKAPQEIIVKERERLLLAQQTLTKLTHQLEKINAL